MDATNETLRLVGHAISLDKVLTRIARLAPGSMLADVRTHQQTTQTSNALFGVTNRSAKCNWHCNRAFHHFLYARRRLGRRDEPHSVVQLALQQGTAPFFYMGVFLVLKENV
jgi:hypothetical protein